MNKIQEIKMQKVLPAVGPYSQAVIAGDFVFCSGQIGLDPKTNVIITGGIEEETKQSLKNIENILKTVGHDLQDVVRVDIFLTSIDDFVKVNKLYASFFKNDPKPARQTAQVSKLPRGAHIEISCIAYLGK